MNWNRQSLLSKLQEKLDSHWMFPYLSKCLKAFSKILIKTFCLEHFFMDFKITMSYFIEVFLIVYSLNQDENMYFTWLYSMGILLGRYLYSRNQIYFSPHYILYVVRLLILSNFLQFFWCFHNHLHCSSLLDFLLKQPDSRFSCIKSLYIFIWEESRENCSYRANFLNGSSLLGVNQNIK